MTKVKFEVEIDSSKPSHTDALNSFLKVVGGQETPVSQEEPESDAKEEPKKKRTRRTKAQTKADKAAEEAKNEQTESQEEETPEIDLVDIRALLSKKIQEGGDEAREKCFDKLKELEAVNENGKHNISSLAPEHYQAFVDFLNNEI